MTKWVNAQMENTQNMASATTHSSETNGSSNASETPELPNPPAPRPSGLHVDATSVYEKVEKAISEIRNGRMVILVDDEDRENEGDLCMAGELVTPEAINFMATHARGLICVTLTEEQVSRLQLPLMQSVSTGVRSGPPLGTAFTVSVEARRGVTTGISAADRSHTTRVLVNPTTRPDDLVTPGHVFPLRARPGGVLVRAGQTEGSVDLARLAGLTPAGVICEIMNDDGTMARMPQLEVFAQKHGLMILTIADLIQYRLRMDRLVRRQREQLITLDQTGTTWRAISFEVELDGRQVLALVKGEPSPTDPVLVRMHAGALVADLFSSSERDGGRKLRESIRVIEEAGAGAIVYFPTRTTPSDELASLSAQVATPTERPEGAPTVLHEYGVGVQVLANLGIRRLKLLTNTPRRLAGLAGFGLEIVECISL
ncbi:MAG: 3,4-dihydroxy-2-butanone-4-phosphate synthase [Polyangiaceae bacterium]